MQAVYIVSALRSPVGKAKGVLSSTRPDDLLSAVLRATREAHPFFPFEQLDDVIIGCAMPEGEQGMNVARMATLLAGFPDTVPAMTVNRFCASGLQAIALAASRIATGEAEAIIAGGVESMTRVPMGGFRYSPNPRCVHEKDHMAMVYSMGVTAEKVAKKYQITRDAQDQFAYRSHQNALRAIRDAEGAEAIVPIKTIRSIPDFSTGRAFSLTHDVTQDQGPRADTSVEILSKLSPVFQNNGTITAGNSSQMSDGAAAVLLVSERCLRQYEWTPLARFCSFAVKGVAPEWMGIGPVEAIPLALKQANVRLAEIDRIELNEAFAAQSLAVIQQLDLDKEKVNPNGGAIALGHPLGATGAILTTRLLHALRQHEQRFGMVTMCIGTGMGAAGIVERV